MNKIKALLKSKKDKARMKKSQTGSGPVGRPAGVFIKKSASPAKKSLVLTKKDKVKKATKSDKKQLVGQKRTHGKTKEVKTEKKRASRK